MASPPLPPAGPAALNDTDALDELLAKITAEDASTHALVRLTPAHARSDLERVLAARRAGSALPLDGETFVAKDNIDVGGVPCTLGSHGTDAQPALRDAETVRRIRAAGGILIGMANMHELAFGATSENPHFGEVRNPWDPSRNAGGSSGGSAVAVALDWVTTSLGTDTGGSVRCPAAIAGVTGLRPSAPLVSTDGLHPLAPSLDTVGFIARDARTVQKLLITVSTHPLPEAVNDGTTRIGIPSHPYFSDLADAQVAERVSIAADALAIDCGRMVTTALPDPVAADHTARLLVRAEAWQVFGSQVTKTPDAFGPDVVSRLQLGRSITPTQVASLLVDRERFARDMDAVFDDVDVIIVPTVPRAPRFLGAVDALGSTEQNLAFTYLWGLAGLPAISVPCGFDDDGLPVGMQVIGRHGTDRLVCQIAQRYQQLTHWHTERPSERLSS